MNASLREFRVFASVVGLSAIVLAGCSTNTPTLESPSVAPAAAPSMPSQYRPEEMVGRWGYGAYHNESDLARTTSAAPELWTMTLRDRSTIRLSIGN